MLSVWHLRHPVEGRHKIHRVKLRKVRLIDAQHLGRDPKTPGPRNKLIAPTPRGHARSDGPQGVQILCFWLEVLDVIVLHDALIYIVCIRACFYTCMYSFRLCFVVIVVFFVSLSLSLPLAVSPSLFFIFFVSYSSSSQVFSGSLSLDATTSTWRL